MSFSSNSSNKRNYRNPHHGSTHYKKKGLFSNLFDMIGSVSIPHGNHNNYKTNYNNEPMPVQPVASQNTLYCSKCNAEIPAGSKFCLQCGERVATSTFCPECGEKLPADAKFCLKCGTKISK